MIIKLRRSERIVSAGIGAKEGGAAVVVLNLVKVM